MPSSLGLITSSCLLVLHTFNHGQKSWDTFAFLGRFPIHTGPTPPLTAQTMLDPCIQKLFRVSTLYRAGGGRTAGKFRKRCTVLRGNPRNDKNMNITVLSQCRIQTSRDKGGGGWSSRLLDKGGGGGAVFLKKIFGPRFGPLDPPLCPRDFCPGL